MTTEAPIEYTLEEVLELLKSPDTRLKAAEIVLGRPVDSKDISITQHLIGIMEPEERFTQLLVERDNETRKKNQ